LPPHLRRRHTSKLLVTEAEGLLGGTVVQVYRDQGMVPPLWVRVNALAHSDFPALTELAKRGSRAHPGTWDEVLGSLARDLIRMDLSGTERSGAELTNVQRRALVPLEIELLAHDRVPERTPEQLRSVVCEALHNYRIGP
jgi:hypothetical protein